MARQGGMDCRRLPRLERYKGLRLAGQGIGLGRQAGAGHRREAVKRMYSV